MIAEDFRITELFRSYSAIYFRAAKRFQDLFEIPGRLVRAGRPGLSGGRRARPGGAMLAVLSHPATELNVYVWTCSYKPKRAFGVS
jgi:hypothetical protein